MNAMFSKIIKSIELLLVAIVREFLAIPAYITLFFAEVAKTYSRIRYRQQMLANKRRALNIRRERERLVVKAQEAELIREKAEQKLKKKLEAAKLPGFWERRKLRKLEAQVAEQVREAQEAEKRHQLEIAEEREYTLELAREKELDDEKLKQELEDAKLPGFWEKRRLRKLEEKLAKQKREAEEARKEHELEMAEENEHALELARQRELSAIQASNEAHEARGNDSVPQWLPLWAQNLLSKKVLWFVAIVIALFVANSYFGFVTFEKNGSTKSGSVTVTHGDNNSENYPTLEEKK